MLKNYNSAEFKALNAADQAYVASLLDTGHDSIVGFLSSQQFKDLCVSNYPVAIAITVESAMADYVNLRPLFTQAVSPVLMQNIATVIPIPTDPNAITIPATDPNAITTPTTDNTKLYWIAGGVVAVIALFLLFGRSHDSHERSLQSNPTDDPDDDFCEIDTNA